MIKSLYDILSLIDTYYLYLNERNVKFNEQGFPLFEKEMFATTWPKQVIPYDHRKNKIVAEKSSTVICFFSKDERIYPRLEKVFREIPVYKEYAGVIAADVTVTEDMDLEWQRLVILLNQLFLMILAINGVKIIANLRIGSPCTLDCLDTIPRNVMCASGFLGCLKQKQGEMTYITKLMNMRPSKLVIYGKHDAVAEEQMSRMGIEYNVYPDFHQLCKGMVTDGR